MTADSVATGKEERRGRGIDEMTVKGFELRREEFLDSIHEKLKTRRYRFKPARRALISKEGKSGS